MHMDWVRAALCAVAILGTGPAFAQSQAPAQDVEEGKGKEKVYLYMGTYFHYSQKDEHTDVPITGGIEWRRPNDWLYGLNLANNSYDQFTQYLYVGKRFALPWWQLHAKVTGGVLHGYTGEYEDKLPINFDGWAPAIVPSIGRDFGRIDANVVALGLSGLLFTLGYDIWD